MQPNAPFVSTSSLPVSFSPLWWQQMMFLFTDKPPSPSCPLIASLSCCLKRQWATLEICDDIYIIKQYCTFKFTFLTHFYSFSFSHVLWSFVCSRCLALLFPSLGLLTNSGWATKAYIHFFKWLSFLSVFRLPKATSSCLMCWVEGMTSTSMSLSIQGECSTHTDSHTHWHTHVQGKWAEKEANTCCINLE